MWRIGGLFHSGACELVFGLRGGRLCGRLGCGVRFCRGLVACGGGWGGGGGGG